MRVDYESSSFSNSIPPPRRTSRVTNASINWACQRSVPTHLNFNALKSISYYCILAFCPCKIYVLIGQHVGSHSHAKPIFCVEAQMNTNLCGIQLHLYQMSSGVCQLISLFCFRNINLKARQKCTHFHSYRSLRLYLECDYHISYRMQL